MGVVTDLYCTSVNWNKSAGHRQWELEWKKWHVQCNCQMCILWNLKTLKIPSQLTSCHSRKTQVFLICQPLTGIPGTLLSQIAPSMCRQVNWTPGVQTEHKICVNLIPLASAEARADCFAVPHHISLLNLLTPHVMVERNKGLSKRKAKEVSSVIPDSKK